VVLPPHIEQRVADKVKQLETNDLQKKLAKALDQAKAAQDRADRAEAKLATAATKPKPRKLLNRNYNPSKSFTCAGQLSALPEADSKGNEHYDRYSPDYTD
jgi:hypothetical protein